MAWPTPATPVVGRQGTSRPATTRPLTAMRGKLRGYMWCEDAWGDNASAALT
ncbi:hypothetical protein ABZV61_40610 [Streptomyces sp900116325]|uniref:Transposase n=1 Tax=Streptomyces sp. 900116325 TaxID=3154295 RepID=A0ABV2ULZ7_9ACTN